MTINELKSQLERTLLEKANELARAGDLKETEYCLQVRNYLEQTCQINRKEPTRQAEPEPHQEPEPTPDLPEWEIETAMEYTQNLLSLNESELEWLDESAICKAGDPKADKIWNTSADNLRKHLKNGNVKATNVGRDYAYYRYSILLKKHGHNDPWGGLDEA